MPKNLLTTMKTSDSVWGEISVNATALARYLELRWLMKP